MSKWSFLSTALMVLALNTPAHADWSSVSRNAGLGSSVFTSAGGGTVVYDGGKGIPSYGAPHGYPFYSSCSEPRSSCCSSLWTGFRSKSRCHHAGTRGCMSCGGRSSCGRSSCGMGCRTHRVRRSSCGCGVPSCGGCSAGKGHAFYGGKGGHIGGSCGCGASKSFGRSCGCGGHMGHMGRCGSCRPFAGLFGWLHTSLGCGGGVIFGGTVISGSKVYGGNYHGGKVYGGQESMRYHESAPTTSGEAIEMPTPAPPTPDPISTQSATKWWSPQRLLSL
jgi:hypothetical protein